MSHQSGCTPASFRHRPSASSFARFPMLVVEVGLRSRVYEVQLTSKDIKISYWGHVVHYVVLQVFQSVMLGYTCGHFHHCSRQGREHQSALHNRFTLPGRVKTGGTWGRHWLSSVRDLPVTELRPPGTPSCCIPTRFTGLELFCPGQVLRHSPRVKPSFASKGTLLVKPFMELFVKGIRVCISWREQFNSRSKLSHIRKVLSSACTPLSESASSKDAVGPGGGSARASSRKS